MASFIFHTKRTAYQETQTVILKKKKIRLFFNLEDLQQTVNQSCSLSILKTRWPDSPKDILKNTADCNIPTTILIKKLHQLRAVRVQSVCSTKLGFKNEDLKKSCNTGFSFKTTTVLTFLWSPVKTVKKRNSQFVSNCLQHPKCC